MSTLTWTETHPAWTPAPVFEAEIAITRAGQRNYLQISQFSKHFRVDPTDPSKGIVKRAIDRFGVTRLNSDNDSSIAIDGQHIFSTLAEAQAAAQDYFDNVWTPAVEKARVRGEMVARQYAEHQARANA